MTQIPDPEAPAELPPPTAESKELGAGAEPTSPVAPPPAEGSVAPASAEGPVAPAPVEEPFAPAPAEGAFVPPLPEPLVVPPAPRRRRLRWLRPELRARDLAVFIRGALLLVITGFCIAAFVMQLTGTFRVHGLWNLPNFVNRNELAMRARMQMLGWLGAGGALGGVLALAFYVWRPRRRSAAGRAARVLRTGRLVLPLMLPSLAWSLLVATGWDPLSRVSGIVFVALLAEVSVRGAAHEVLGGRLALARLLARAGAAAGRAFARARRLMPLEIVAVLLAAAFYAVWMSWGTILQHRQFGTSTFDLGNYDTMFFNALHGRPFRCPSVFPKGPSWSMLSVHAELTMFALLPFYALHPGAETLLVLQAVALASGAIPLYRFAARRLPRTVALMLVLAYLLYGPMHQTNFYDFHFPPFAVAFTLWALDMLDARRPALFAVFFALALGCREDVALGFTVLGVYLLLRGKHTRVAIVMTVVSVVYFVVMKLFVMPHFQGTWFASLTSDPTEEYGYRGAFRTLLVNPLFSWKALITVEKISLFLLVLVPVIFLPLRRRLLWMCLLPAIPFAMVTPGYGPTVQNSFQYVMLFVPFLFLASALALAAFHGAPNGRARLAGAVGGIAMATLLTTRVWGAMPPGDQNSSGFRGIPVRRPVTAVEKQKARDIAELTTKIPRDASVAATEMEHPHASARLNALALRNGYEGADYILYSEDGGGAELARQALATGMYELVESRPATRMSLLRKKKH